MEKHCDIIEIYPSLRKEDTENINYNKNQTKGNIINFDLYKKYQIIVITC